MPLSDREQQILADIEARLLSDDPQFARAVAASTADAAARRKLKLAVALFAACFLLLPVSLLVSALWLGLLGFGGMLVAVARGGTALRALRMSGNGSAATQHPPRGPSWRNLPR